MKKQGNDFEFTENKTLQDLWQCLGLLVLFLLFPLVVQIELVKVIIRETKEKICKFVKIKLKK